MLLKPTFEVILILPLLSALITLAVGRVIGKQGAFLLASVLMMFELFLVVIIFIAGLYTKLPFFASYGIWFASGYCTVEWGFYADSLTRIMLLIVVSVSALVHIFSSEYMLKDPHSVRFMSYLSIFTWFMVVLVTANNLVLLFVGWEGVGISSYLLINFWYTRVQANKAALKALLMNRIGDCFLMIGIIVMFKTFGSVNFTVVNHLAYYFSTQTIQIFPGIVINNLSLISISLIIGAIGKSAQLGLHTWLPDAMEGPTPVSALIHAATMVTAGVYLVLRTALVLESTPYWLLVLVMVGSLTALYGSITACWQNDVKKIIAYSTCSQLGYMFVACGLSLYTTSLYHLFNHAFFKAGLFLASGIIIHSLSEEQDVRRLGGLRSKLPIVYVIMLIGSLSLCGYSFSSGFYSKDFILGMSGTEGLLVSGSSIFIYINIAAIYSIVYSFRLLQNVFYSDFRIFKASVKGYHPSTFTSYNVLIILGVLSIISGYFFERLFKPASMYFNELTSCYEPVHYVEAEFVPLSIRIIPLVFLILWPIVDALSAYDYVNDSYTSGIGLDKFFLGKGYFDVIYNKFIVLTIWKFSWFLYRTVDKGILEYLGPSRVLKALSPFMANLMIVQGKSLQVYLSIGYLVSVWTLFLYDLCSILLWF